MCLADDEKESSTNGADTSGAGLGNGTGDRATESEVDKGGATWSGKKRESDTGHVDLMAAARIKEAEKAEETRKKDAAFLEDYEERVKEVGILRGFYVRTC